MQSFGTGLHRARTRRQSGAVAMLGALWLMIAVICLATIDIGNVFWQKRELQKIADLAALAGASGNLNSGSCEINSKINSIANDAKNGDVRVAISGNWSILGGKSYDFFQSTTNPLNACRVKFTRVVPLFFMISSNGRLVEAEATAARKSNLARVFVRTTLVDISSDREANLLSLLLGGLLGSNLNVKVLGWQGLAKLNVNLLNIIQEFPLLKLNLNSGDYDKLLSTEVGVGELLTALVTAVEKNLGAADAGLVALKSISAAAKISPLKMKLGDLLKLQAGSKSDALNLSTNVFELVQALIQVGNGNNALVGNIEIPLVKIGAIYQGAKVALTVIEKPQWMLGDPDVVDVLAKTAQLRLSVLTELLGVKVDVQLEAGGASAKMPKGRYSCAVDDKRMDIIPSASILRINKLQLNILGEQIGPVGVDVKGKSSDGYVTIAKLGGTPSVVKDAQSNPPSNIDKPLLDSDWRNFEGDLNLLKSISDGLKKLIKDILDSDVKGVITLALKVLLGLLSPLTDAVSWIVGNILSPLLDSIVNELLKVIGVDI
ncbi:MAG: pilus assembly protein TadG-related protein [Comamonas sp.]